MIDIISSKGGTVCLNKSDFSTIQLTPYLFENKDQIKPNPYGIPEPTSGVEVDVSIIDIIIVPLLAFNDKGYRVGYGKGFYDNYLKRCSKKCIFIGVNHFNEVNQIDDIGNQDIPLDFIVTPEKIYAL
jgi:5-formyltetrahydrofolate cyclo-ligase